MKIKRITSLCLSWSFLILIFSSLVLYVLPSGKVAHWANWAFLGLSKEQWAALHTNNGYLFLIACAFHIYFNFSHILNYLKNRNRELTGMNANSLVAFLLVLVFAVMTLLGLPPVSWIQDLNGHFKSQAERKFGVPPYGHAELSSLREFARRTGLDADDIVRKLLAAGFEGVNASTSISTIAAQNHVSPQTLINALSGEKESDTSERKAGGDACSGTPVSGKESGSGSLGVGGGGYGQKTLKAVCSDLGLDGPATLQRLKSKGYHGKLSDSVKSIAESKGERPSVLVQILHEMAENAGE